MAFKSDIEIAQENELAKITEIAKKIGIGEDHLELYGSYKAKISADIWEKIKDNKDGKLILVTAITPTPAGEGKTTTTVGLADGMNLIGEKVMVALREPSLGPVFGMKGGAAGGGYAQIVPMEDINLHFTGDFNAIGAANNLLAAMLDNHINHGNELGIDARTITLKRVVDMNDRQLRFIVDGLNGKANGVPREDGFEIVVASEVMAILCLSNDLKDLKELKNKRSKMREEQREKLKKIILDLIKDPSYHPMKEKELCFFLGVPKKRLPFKSFLWKCRRRALSAFPCKGNTAGRKASPKRVPFMPIGEASASFP